MADGQDGELALQRLLGPGTSLDAGALAMAALDLLPDAVIVVDLGLRIRVVNEAGRRLLAGKRGLNVRDNRLEAPDRFQSAALAAVVRDPRERRGGCLRLRAPGGAELWVRSAPLAPGAALLQLLPAQANEQAQAQALCCLFSTTRAEAEVAASLGAGRSPAAIARQRGVSLSTVRCQVRAVLGKTGARGVPDLVRIINRLPRDLDAP
jgi:DNA-binding CsgD family transcriptional regulator